MFFSSQISFKDSGESDDLRLRRPQHDSDSDDDYDHEYTQKLSKEEMGKPVEKISKKNKTKKEKSSLKKGTVLSW